jgi:hypothetical protein
VNRVGNRASGELETPGAVSGLPGRYDLNPMFKFEHPLMTKNFCFIS